MLANAIDAQKCLKFLTNANVFNNKKIIKIYIGYDYQPILMLTFLNIKIFGCAV